MKSLKLVPLYVQFFSDQSVSTPLIILCILASTLVLSISETLIESPPIHALVSGQKSVLVGIDPPWPVPFVGGVPLSATSFSSLK